MHAQSLLFSFPIARGLSFEIYITTIKTAVSARIDVTPNLCVAMDVTADPSYHQKKILSRLSLLLRRCLTPATVQRPQQNLQGPQTYRRIQPLALQKGNGPTTQDSLWRLPEKQYNIGIYPDAPNTGR